MKLIKKLTILTTFIYCFSIASQITTYSDNTIRCRTCRFEKSSTQWCQECQLCISCCAHINKKEILEDNFRRYCFCKKCPKCKNNIFRIEQWCRKHKVCKVCCYKCLKNKFCKECYNFGNICKICKLCVNCCNGSCDDYSWGYCKKCHNPGMPLSYYGKNLHNMCDLCEKHCKCYE